MENTLEKTLNFLTEILQSLGMTVKGRSILIEGEDGEYEIEVDGKTLVLPTEETLKLSKWDKEIAFFPLCESTLRGESEVQHELLSMVKGAVNVRLASLLWELFKVANSEECKANKLSPEQAEFLPHIPGFDANMVKNMGKLVLGVDPTEYKTSLIHMNLKRRTKINGQPFDRACLVRFPLAEMERKEKPFGVELRVKDMDALLSLLDYVLPDWQIENSYSRGTDSKVAPYFVATLMAYQNINARITLLAKRFVPTFPKFGALVNEDNWVECMDDLHRMRDCMPNLPGNDGAVVRGGGNGGDAPIITNEPKVARSAPMPTKTQPNLPWEEQSQAQSAPAQPTHRAPAADDDVVEYVPRQAVHPQAGQIPVGHEQTYATPGTVPAGYGSTNGPSFAEIQRSRMQGPAYAAVNQPPPVGGSSFSSDYRGADTTGNVNGYNVGYVTPAANQYAQPTGRGY
jgi:hypothetical protein